MENYEEFLKGKMVVRQESGFTVHTNSLNDVLFDWQKKIVSWALKCGRAAIFEDCGMGKTFQQLEWAKHVQLQTGGDVIILAPLAVARQTQVEGKKLGIDVHLCRSQEDVKRGLNITNYEMMSHFNIPHFTGVVLDESSILKSFTGKIRNEIIEGFNQTPYKLACTATPAPNDQMELGNHAEFLNVMTRSEMLSMYFVHDGGETSKWRLKGHAKNEFWAWVATWAAYIRKPSDLGYSDDGFVLPELKIHEHVIESESDSTALFSVPASGLMERRRARKNSLSDRVKMAIDIVNNSDEQWVVWCNLNDESALLSNGILDAVEVTGSDKPDFKTESMIGFQDGNFKVLVTKPSICGFGMNWQHCRNVMFVGLSDSWEQYYQAIRRCWRFGQLRDVNCHIIISEREMATLDNIKRKNDNANEMANEIKDAMGSKFGMSKEVGQNQSGVLDTVQRDKFALYRGDCVEVLSTMDNDSVDYSIFSPPFASLYTYSDSVKDMGNSADYEQFCQHMRFLVSQLKRVLKAGRLVSIHCFDIPAMKQKDGFIGLIDFPSDLRAIFQDQGFIYHSKVTIWKDPVVQMQRTKALGLLHKQIRKDSSMSRQGIADYLVTMRAPGVNCEPIAHTHETFPVDRWQQYASPVWMDINPSRTLNREGARDDQDERHICPLQLDVIERGIELWSNPGDTVLTPFAGIGSEVYSAIIMGRYGVGIELKQSYFNQAVKNCENAEISSSQTSLFNEVVAMG